MTRWWFPFGLLLNSPKILFRLICILLENSSKSFLGSGSLNRCKIQSSLQNLKLSWREPFDYDETPFWNKNTCKKTSSFKIDSVGLHSDSTLDLPTFFFLLSTQDLLFCKSTIRQRSNTFRLNFHQLN